VGERKRRRSVRLPPNDSGTTLASPFYPAMLPAVLPRGRFLARFVVTLVFLMPSVAPLVMHL